MKRILSVIISLVLALSLVGCGEINEPDVSDIVIYTPDSDITESKTVLNSNGKITVTANEYELHKLTTSDAETKLRKMGFTDFAYEQLNITNRNDLDGKIFDIEIETDKGDFEVGDTYDVGVRVILWSYKYSKTENTVTGSTKPSESSESAVDEVTSTDTVWISQSGTKYHSNSGCSGMKNPTGITVAQAEQRGYSPCGRCY